MTSWAQDDLRPIPSPNGRYVAFYADSPLPGHDEQKIWNLHVIAYVKGKTYTAEELAKTIVASDVVVDLNTGPAWSPDSTKIFL